MISLYSLCFSGWLDINLILYLIHLNGKLWLPWCAIADCTEEGFALLSTMNMTQYSHHSRELEKKIQSQRSSLDTIKRQTYSELKHVSKQPPHSKNPSNNCSKAIPLREIHIYIYIPEFKSNLMEFKMDIHILPCYFF